MIRALRTAAVVVCMSAALLAGCSSGGGEPTSVMLTDAEMSSAPTLTVGDLAPPIIASEWLRGAAVKGPETGKVYAIDFWASWCGPCLAIMPRMSKLQEKYTDRGLVVIALTALDDANSRSDVIESLEEIKDIRFHVGIDGGKDGMETTAAYLRASRETGIPRTFVIDQDGRLAWIGHPQDADRVIEEVLDRTWDVSKAAEYRRTEIMERQASRKLIDQWRAARERDDVTAQLLALDQLTSFDPENVAFSPPFSLHAFRIELLTKDGPSQEAQAAFNTALEYPSFAKEPWALAELVKSMRSTYTPTTDKVARDAEKLVASRDARNPADVWDKFIFDAEKPWDTQALQVLSEYWHARGDQAQAIRLINQSIERTDRRYPRAVEIREELLKRYQSSVNEAR